MGRKHTVKMTNDPIGANEVPRAWTFEDNKVAEKFDDHVREQLSWYDPLSRFVADIAVSFLPPKGVLYDIGASTGNVTKLMRDDIDAKDVQAISIEAAHAMAGKWSGAGNLHVLPAEDFDFANKRPDVSIMFLTLMFMPPSIRRKFLKKIFRATRPGGAVIIVDKGYLTMTETQIACKAATVAEKYRSGTPADSYMAKELSLRGEQRPTTKVEIEDLAFDELFLTEEFFRFGEFYGMLCIKRSI